MARLYTLGYEGASVDGFVATLEAAGVRTLIDVREVPFSRKKGFSKSALAGRLAVAGIDYVHLKGLGTPKRGRDAAKAGRRDEFEAIFADHMTTPAARADLERAIGLVNTGASCLMCLEREPERCHRRVVADRIAARTGVEVRHLFVAPLSD